MQKTIKILAAIRDYVFINKAEKISILELAAEACDNDEDQMKIINTLFEQVREQYRSRLTKSPYYWEEPIEEVELVDYWDYILTNVEEVNMQKIMFINTSIDYFV